MAPGRQEVQPFTNEEAASLEKAFQELAKGERTATALENQLGKMEARIQALLDQAEREQKDVQQLKGGANQASEGDKKEGQGNEKQN